MIRIIFGVIMILSCHLAIGQKKAVANKKVVITKKKTVEEPKYNTAPSGLKYFFFKNNGGPKAKIGDVVVNHFLLMTMDDSVINSSYRYRDLTPLQLDPPQYPGDRGDACAMMGKGDSAVFLISSDSLYNFMNIASGSITGHERARIVSPVPSGSMLKYIIKMEDIMSMKEYNIVLLKKEAAEAKRIADLKLNEPSVISKYIEKRLPQAKKTASGMYYAIEKTGNGPAPKAGQEVVARFKCTLLNGMKCDWNENMRFRVGASEIGKGLEEGLVLLNKGAKAKLVVPSWLAFGEIGVTKVPPYSPVIFDVELIDIRDSKFKVSPEGVRYIMCTTNGGKKVQQNDSNTVHFHLTLKTENDSIIASEDHSSQIANQFRCKKFLHLLAKGESALFEATIDDIYFLSDHPYLPFGTKVHALIKVKDVTALGESSPYEKQYNNEDRKPQMDMIGEYYQEHYAGKKIESDPAGMCYIIDEAHQDVYEKPEYFSTCTVHLKCQTLDGKQLGGDNGKGVTFHMGKNIVLNGLERGIYNMPAGSKAIIFVPSWLAYGADGNAALGVPPNMPLIYEVEMVKIDNSKD